MNAIVTTDKNGLVIIYLMNGSYIIFDSMGKGVNLCRSLNINAVWKHSK